MPALIKQCEHCSTSFQTPHLRQRFCSRTCSNIAVPRRMSTKVLGKCVFCSNTVSHYTNHYCKECIAIGRHSFNKNGGRGISAEVTIDGLCRVKNGANKFDTIRARARSSIGTKECCERCGYSKHVEVAHIKAISSFPPNTLVSVVNDRSNLMLLCPNCHWEYDNGKV